MKKFKRINTDVKIDVKIVEKIEKLSAELGKVMSKFLYNTNKSHARNVGTNALCNILIDHIKILEDDIQDQYQLLEAIENHIVKQLTMRAILEDNDNDYEDDKNHECESCGKNHKEDKKEISAEDEADTTEYNDNKKYKGK